MNPMFVGEHEFSLLVKDHCALSKRLLYPLWADHASGWANQVLAWALS
jgi:hypothetical protein